MTSGSVMVAMSGGVDSSVAAAVLIERGLDVVGVTMKLWGGPADRGCCSVADVDDARWAADRLGIEHHVFNFGDEFERDVVAPYVADHAAGRTPNPCVECNRHIKFDRLVARARALGFERLATGHHARVVSTPDGPAIARGADRAKDQSYVLHPVRGSALAMLDLPVGDMTKAQVRERAAQLGLATAAKPDSQDVCFITAAAGRGRFLAERLELTPGRVIDATGEAVGRVDAVELVTVGQRKGLELAGGTAPRYVVDVDVGSATVVVGDRRDLDRSTTPLEQWSWTRSAFDGAIGVQTSAHGPADPGRVADGRVVWDRPRRAVAAGQSVVAYVDDVVVGSGVAGRL